MSSKGFDAVLWGPKSWGLKESIMGGEAPKVSNTAAATVQTEATKQKKSRLSLFETAGASAGQELMSGQVGRRSTLLGN